MPNFCKAQIFIKYPDGHGTSMGHYYAKAAASLDVVRPEAHKLQQKTAALFGEGVELLATRLSFTDVYRDSLFCKKLDYPDPLVRVYNAQLANAKCDISGVTNVIRAEGGPLYRRTILLVGVPDKENANPALPAWSREFSDAYLDWYNYLVGANTNWGFLVSSVEEADAPIKKVTAVALLPGGPAASTATMESANHGLPIGEIVPIRCRGFKFKNGRLSGTLHAIASDANSFDLKEKFTGLDTYLGGGVMQRIVKKVVPYSNLIWQRTGTKKVGLPYGMRRGR